MLKRVVIWTGIVLVGGGYLQAAGQQTASPTAPPASQYRAVLNRYCVTCHNEKLRTAGLTLGEVDFEKVSEAATVWEKVLWKLRTGAMPPAGAPRPDKATYDSLTTYLETELDRAAAANPNPGRPTVRRLSRVEYSNAIRDLLAIEVDGESLLPADDMALGFDNIAKLLSVSPLLMERYMSGAERITRLALGDRTIRPTGETYRVSGDLVQNERVSEDLPFGSRGGIAIRHDFPLDGEYVIQIRLQKETNGHIRGLLNGEQQLDVRLDGKRIKLFTVGVGDHGRALGETGPLFTRAGPHHMGDLKVVGYENTADEGLEFRFPAKAGRRLVGVAFLKRTYEPEGMLTPTEMRGDVSNYKGGDPDYLAGDIAVDNVSITGPFNSQGPGETPSRQKVFVCYPAGGNEVGRGTQRVSLSSGNDEESCAKNVLSTLARRAYRRPVTDGDLQPLLRLYNAGRSQGGFEAGIAMALQGLLVSPKFLFRIERDPENVAPNTPYHISDLELASRLSFFLWSSIPDDALIDVAARGQLQDPAVLEQQVRRMLADPRAKTLVTNFAAQWLNLRNLRQASPDSRAFPDFDENLRQAFQQETELFLEESMIREDHSVLDVLNANYTFLNERLARHYGIPNVYGNHFRRVTLTDEARKGLLGQGSILTITSYGNRTSPVLRGKWVLYNILGTPPPPPPPDVPALKESGADIRNLTMRQRMDQHRDNPVCASCHARMDPIGFALENFDALGHWRTADRGNPLDTSGVLPDGTKFQGMAGLRNFLLSRPEQFVHTIAEKLFIYALGRELESSDAPAVRKVMRDAASGDYRWSSLILGVIKSTPFQMRMSAEPATTASLR